MPVVVCQLGSACSALLGTPHRPHAHQTRSIILMLEYLHSSRLGVKRVRSGSRGGGCGRLHKCLFADCGVAVENCVVGVVGDATLPAGSLTFLPTSEVSQSEAPVASFAARHGSSCRKTTQLLQRSP